MPIQGEKLNINKKNLKQQILDVEASLAVIKEELNSCKKIAENYDDKIAKKSIMEIGDLREILRILTETMKDIAYQDVMEV